MKALSVAKSLVASAFPLLSSASLEANETSEGFHLQTNGLHVHFNKTLAAIDSVTLGGEELLGPVSSSRGLLYVDCLCTGTSGYTWGHGPIPLDTELVTGRDSTGTEYAGVILTDNYVPTGQVFQQYWFIRDGQTGLHGFSRQAYKNESVPFLRSLQEWRTLFRPNNLLWTDLVTSENFHAPAPVPDPAGLTSQTLPGDVVVQDTTWYLGNRSNDPFVESTSDYFTKYTFSDSFRATRVSGLYANGSNSQTGHTFGAWMVRNTLDTYFGGPLYSDLLVDGILYNYILSNHHGDQVPNITTGFDRTVGPYFYYWNQGSSDTTLEELYADANELATPLWNADFYDSISKHVVGYVPTSGRGVWNGHVKLPKGARNAIAVLSADGVGFQDNAIDTKAYQYWADITACGNVAIPQVKAGTYRLTVYADEIFGWFEQDGIKIEAGKTTKTSARWTAESAGTELWRIGTPDKAGGEWKHGNTPDLSHPNQPPEYRIYWGAYDFPTDFPNGVHYHVGSSKEAEDFNYIHWSMFGGAADFNRLEPYYENVNNWTITFDLESSQLIGKKMATFTVQLAGAKTASGNTDDFNATQTYANLPLTISVNGEDQDPWVIPYWQSSSCGARSAIQCYNLDHKYVFGTELLKQGTNKLVLSLPANATDYESALLPTSTYVQYDALRLEVK